MKGSERKILSTLEALENNLVYIDFKGSDLSDSLFSNQANAN